MSEKESGGTEKGVSKVKLAVGAASLFLFIIGVKRTFRMDEDGDGGPEERVRSEVEPPFRERRSDKGRSARDERKSSRRTER